MKVYLINLDKDKDRLAAFDAQAKKLGINYVRIPGVYAKAMPSDKRKSYVNRFRWWCAVGRPVRDGEIGCALSHYGIYGQGLDEAVCILEDDVLLDDRFAFMLGRIAEFVSLEKNQVVLLSNHTGAIKPSEKFGIVPAKSDMYTEGYVITPKAMKALLKDNLPMKCPCDWWGRWAERGLIELYHACPAVCSQDQSQYKSETADGDCFRVSGLPVVRKLVHKALRLAGILLDKILP